MEGGLAVEDADESCFSGLSFSRSLSLSLSFLKMWASWTISVGGGPSVFFFSFRRGSNVDEGGRNAEIGTEPRFGSGKGPSMRGSREDQVGAMMKMKKKKKKKRKADSVPKKKRKE